jgi:capsular polysaccharide transport system permease protein
LKLLFLSLLRLLKNTLFVITVLIPTFCAFIYYGFIASDVYISESRFVVRSPQRQQSASVLGAIFSNSGFQQSQDDVFSVHDFVLSRDALKKLNSEFNLKEIFGTERADFLARYPSLFSDTSFESLYKYYIKHVTIESESASSISTLRVRSYDQKTAYEINESLLVMSESLINQINLRARSDLINYASAEVKEAELKAKEAALNMAAFRNKRAVFDPERQSATQLLLVSKLQDELIATKMQLTQVKTLAPDNPQITVLQQRAIVLQRDMDIEMAKVAGSGDNSLSNKTTDFERLGLDKAFADRQLASALASLETARNESRRKQLYLERIVQPNTPDASLEPRRIRSVLIFLILGLMAWGILSLLIASLREHKN